MSDICVDTGFLLGLYVESDQYHRLAGRYFDDYFATTRNRLIVPWPILYETVSTRLIKNRQAIVRMESDWRRLSAQDRLEFLSDVPFRDGLVEECFDELTKSPTQARHLSLVDRVIRGMLSDVNVRVEALITFNPGDFADVCKRARRQLLSQ